MVKNENESLWRELHEMNRHRPKYPQDQVVRYVFRNFSRDGHEKILDLGCGAGRHVMFLAAEEIIPYGLDFSAEGVSHTRKMLVENHMGAYAEHIKVGNMTELPFSDGMFDGIICYGVLYYLGMEDIKKAVSEMYRVLCAGGKAMVSVRSVWDYRCLSSDAIPTEEANTYIINENDSAKSASSETGMLMHFFEEKEIRELFGAFDKISIGRITETHEDGAYADDDFIVTCVK